MSIKAFATLRSVLRRSESKLPDEHVKLSNMGEWHNTLREAVKKCYESPLEGLPGFDAEGIARVAVRVSEPTAAVEFPREQAIRRAIIAELVSPALKAVASGDKKAIDKAFKGLRTVVEAACAGFVRYYCDRADTENGEAGALFKLQAVRDALEGGDLSLAVARVETLLDPTFTLHLGIATVEEPHRVPTHDGVARFHQRAPHDRPFAVQRLVVTFETVPAAPPAIQAVFVNEALVDAFWEWKTPAEGEAPSPTQYIKLAKAQAAVRSWSAVVANDAVTLIAPEIDTTTDTLVTRTPSGSVRVVVTPGKLVATPLLRDVIMSTLRHFHGSVNQEKVIFSILQHRMEARSDVLVGALPNAAQPAKFHHADADVSVVIPSSPIARRRVGWSALTRLYVLFAVALIVLRRFLKGMKLGVAIGSVVGIFMSGLAKWPFFRRLALGGIVTHNRRINILAVAIARSISTSTNAPAIRTSLVSALTAYSLPLVEVSASAAENALKQITDVAASISSVAVKDAFKSVAFVEGAPAIAAVLSVAGGINVAPSVAAAIKPRVAEVELAVDIILRQSQFIADDTLLLNVAAATDGLPVAWPRVAGRAGAADVTLFAVDRSAVIVPLPKDQSKFLAAVASNLL